MYVNLTHKYKINQGVMVGQSPGWSPSQTFSTVHEFGSQKHLPDRHLEHKDCNVTPPLKSKMATRGLKNGRKDLNIFWGCLEQLLQNKVFD